MKALLVLFAFTLVSGSTTAFSSSDVSSVISEQDLYSLSLVDARNAINWKVGELAEYSVKIANFGINGKMLKTVDKEEGNTVWIKQNIDLTVQKQMVDIQMDRADGKILKMLVNGQPQTIPSSSLEIISQEYGEITVPAGTFQAVHVIAKNDGKNIEVWMNPRDTVMEGSLKQMMDSQFGQIVTELLRFKKVN